MSDPAQKTHEKHCDAMAGFAPTRCSGAVFEAPKKMKINLVYSQTLAHSRDMKTENQNGKSELVNNLQDNASVRVCGYSGEWETVAAADFLKAKGHGDAVVLFDDGMWTLYCATAQEAALE